MAREADLKFQGHQIKDYSVYSLDLPQTKVSVEDSDEYYWIKAKIGEKDAKKIAVVYIGEKIGPDQKQTDYTQIFLDLEDGQIRFDKTNKNPIDLLCRLTAEFPDSTVEIKRRKK